MRMPKKYIVTRDSKDVVNMIVCWKSTIKNVLVRNMFGDFGVMDKDGFVELSPEKYLFKLSFTINDRSNTEQACLEIMGFIPRYGTAYLIENHKDYVYATKLPYIRKNKNL